MAMAKKQKTKKSSKSKGARKNEKEEEMKKKQSQQVLLVDDESSSSEDEREPEPKQEQEPEQEPDQDMKDNTPASSQEKEEKDEEEGTSSEMELEPPSNKQLDEATPETLETAEARAPSFRSDGRYHNKQRCLVLCSRGVTSRFRHLLEDLRTLIPHHKKDSKLSASKNDTGGIGGIVNDVAEMRGCNSVLFLECRKRQDAYMWLGYTNHASAGKSGRNNGGPSAKFLVENIHTMDELRLTGNCMRGSRPLLTFDSAFDQREELKLLKCLFTDIFGSPRGHPKSKPFVDRVMGFYYGDGKIWVRNYQIVEEHAANAKEAHEEKKLHGKAVTTSLVEIGPRFVLNPIKIFRGSFGGQTIYQNDQYTSPNATRAAHNKKKGSQYEDRKNAQKKRKMREEQIVLPDDPLASVFK